MNYLTEAKSNKRKILVIFLSLLVSITIYHIFDLIDYFAYLNPELEWFMLFFTLLFLGILVGSLIPSSPIHGLIVSFSFFAYFVIQFNLRHPAFESWNYNVLYASLSFGGYALVLGFVGVGIRWLIRKPKNEDWF